ncbi:MAG: hypothetical protein IPM54_33465 [Polyangiaceae bacterium]|nr:hypothetical protein [Polyangiaceae bacterium]
MSSESAESKKKLFERRLQPVAAGAIEGAVTTAIEKSAALHGLDTPLGEVRTAVVVESVEQKSGLGKLFGKPKRIRLTAVLTKSWLWLAVDEGNGPSAIALRLAGMEVVDYANTFAAKHFEDHGLELSSFRPGAATRETYFLGLGPDADAEAFAEALRACVTSAGAA